MPFPISGIGDLIHSGPGATELNADHTYTGDTIVTAGTLSSIFPSLADGAAVRLSGDTARLNLAHGQTDTVGSLFINNLPQSAGLWGRTGSIAQLGAQFETPYILGDGLLNVIRHPQRGS